eukprot:GSChrysophyteH1.ASY1.ANO1.2272.1 assembled CDS
MSIAVTVDDPLYRTHILWALYEACEAAKEYEKAWDYLREANEGEWKRRLRSQNGHFPKSLEDEIAAGEDIMQVFGPGFFNSNTISKCKKRPVFIVGIMRTGSTLLESMLDSHPQVWSTGEYSILNTRLPIYHEELMEAASLGINEVQQVQARWSKSIWRDMMNAAASEMKQNAAQVSVDGSTKSSLKEIIPVDKMLFNYRNIGFIHMLFPEAIIINMVRDPMDSLFSTYRKHFEDKGLMWTLLPDHILNQYTIYLKIMSHWRKVLPAGSIVDLRYEELVNKPEKVLRSLIKKIGITWQSEVLEFSKERRTVLTHSMLQMMGGVTNTSIGTWKHYGEQVYDLFGKHFVKKHLRSLKASNALPYAKEMNWNCSLHYDYELGREVEGKVTPKRVAKSPAKQKTKSSETTIAEKPPVKINSKKGSRGHTSLLEYDADLLSKMYLSFNSGSQSDQGLRSPPLAKCGEKVLAWDGPKGAASDAFVERITQDSDTFEDFDNWSTLKDEILAVLDLNATPRSDSQQSPTRSEGRVAETRKVKSGNPVKNATKVKRKTIRKNLDITTTTVPLIFVEKLYSAVIGDSDSTQQLTIDLAGAWLMHFYRTILDNVRSSQLDGVVDALNAIIQVLELSISSEVESLEMATMSEPLQMSELLRVLATSQALQNQYSDSRVTLDKLIAIVGSSDVDALERRSEVALAMGDLETGMKDLRELIKIQQESVDWSDYVNGDLSNFPVSLLQAIIKHSVFLISATENSDSLELGCKDLMLFKNLFEKIRINMLHARSSQGFNSLVELLTLTLNHHRSKELPSQEADMYIYLGKCEKAFGNLDESIDYFSASALIFEAQGDRESQHNALHSRALSYMTLGDIAAAVADLRQILREDPNRMLSWGIYGLMNQNLGKCKETISAFDKVLMLEGHVRKETSPHLLMAMCYRSLGQYNSASERLQTLQSLGVIASQWRRELLSFEYLSQDWNFEDYYIDTSLSAELKLLLVQGAESEEYKTLIETQASLVKDHIDLLQSLPFDTDALISVEGQSLWHLSNQVVETGGFQLNQDLEDRAISFAEKMRPALNRIKPFAKLVQIRTTGFLRNILQHKQFRLAVVHMSLNINKHAQRMSDGGHGGLTTKNAGSSSVTSVGFHAVASEPDRHNFYWRDLYDIAVRYRHISGPLDDVLWTDGLRLQNGEKNIIGMTTYIIHSREKIARYYSQFDKSFQLVKKYILNHGYYDKNKTFITVDSNSKKGANISAAATLEELARATSDGNFYIVTRLQTQENSSRSLPGTLFSIIRADPGYSFSICLPSSPTRFSDYEREMDTAFSRMIYSVKLYRSEARMMQDFDEANAVRLRQNVIDCAFHMFFYWANFGPLTRGTSAVGYAVLASTLASVGLEPVSQLPEGVQLDWEAFYSSSADEFAKRAAEYLHLQRCSVAADLSEEKDLIELIQGISNTRKLKAVLNLEVEE